MPIASYRYVYKTSQTNEGAKAAMAKVGLALSRVSKDELRQEIAKDGGYDVTVTRITPLSGELGVEISFGMEDTPRRADTVKKIADELRALERRAATHLDHQIVLALEDENWERTYAVKASSELWATEGFKVGSARRRSWWFPIGFTMGALATWSFYNFDLIVATLREMMAAGG